MDEIQEISRGKNAARLLADPLLNEALNAIESHFESGWRNTTLSNFEKREQAYRMLSVLQEFKKHLTTFVNTGKMASVAKETREVQELQERRLTEWDGSPDGIA